jgi:tripartite-type tricarboxylate transporter receptor subunit TctC
MAQSDHVTRRKALAALAAAGALALPRPARANWPDRPIRLVIPYGGGGQTDIVSRLIAEAMSRRLGQQITPDNRPGAAGNLAAEMIARAAPDGYTMTIGTVGVLGGLSAALYRNLGYDGQRDFAPIGLFCTAQNVLLVHAGVPARTLPQFIAHVRAHPGQLNFASSGIGATTHLSMELMLERAGGLQMVHVPYRQSTQGMTDLLAGRVQARCLGLPEAEPVKEDDRVRALAVTGAERNPQWPDVPTMGETLPGYEAVNAFGLAVPAHTPSEIVARLSRALNASLADEEVRESFLRVGADPARSNTPEEFTAYVRSRGEMWIGLVRRLGIGAQ